MDSQFEIILHPLTLNCAYHARMACRAQHLRCYVHLTRCLRTWPRAARAKGPGQGKMLCERSERADNKLNKIAPMSQCYPTRALLDVVAHNSVTPVGWQLRCRAARLARVARRCLACRAQRCPLGVLPPQKGDQII